jgi:hypothetical protein
MGKGHEMWYNNQIKAERFCVHSVHGRDGNFIEHCPKSKLEISSSALLTAVLYVNEFIRWYNYLYIVYIKADGLFNTYTVS